MLILILAYLGGVLTIFSPCVLPVIPFVFSRSDQPFRKSGLPMLLGMAMSFSLFAALSVTGGNWVIQANQFGRVFALLIFTILGLTLLFPKFGDQLMSPFVKLGGALQKRADQSSGLASSLLLGASIGLLWAPCAGPILGLLLAGAAVSGTQTKTFLSLLVFAAGAATSLAVAILAGGKLMKKLKQGLGAEEFIKRAVGVIVLLAVVAIGFGLDTRILSKISYVSTNQIEANLVSSLSSTAEKVNLPMPELTGASEWLNSAPITAESLKGKVVLIDFWTYSCINCLRTLPYVKEWARKYQDQGLVVIGVHAPEFAFEKDIANVKKAVKDLGISYPVAIDNDQNIWSAFNNQYWPAHYFIDQKGIIRYTHSGEGDYDQSEKIIQALLMEKNTGQMAMLPSQPLPVKKLNSLSGAELPESMIRDISPETYAGYERAKNFSSQPLVQKDVDAVYAHPKTLPAHHWSLSGKWKIEDERAVSVTGHGSLKYRFRGRDLNLVLGSAKPVRFKVTLDGHKPGKDLGVDIDENGIGQIQGQRLYQLIRKSSGAEENTFEIEFMDSGAEVYAFTFG